MNKTDVMAVANFSNVILKKIIFSMSIFTWMVLTEKTENVSSEAQLTEAAALLNRGYSFQNAIQNKTDLDLCSHSRSM